MPKLPIDSYAGELVTLLEFVRVAVTKFPRTTKEILDRMDLADEALMQDVETLCKQVNFDFHEPREEKPDE
jgi:hypothetical protein